MADSKEELEVFSTLEEGQDRLRKLSEKGKAYLDSQNQEYRTKLDRTIKNINSVPEEVKQCATDLDKLRLCEKNLKKIYSKYKVVSTEYLAFLKRCGVPEIEEQLALHLENNQAVISSVKDMSREIDVKIQELTPDDKTFVHTHKSKKSSSKHHTTSQTSSKLSVILARKLAEAESSKVALEYARKEAELIKKQAEMEAEKALLAHEKKTAVIEAEVKVLQAANESLDESSDGSSIPMEDPTQRTRDYVNNLPDVNPDDTIINDKNICDKQNIPVEQNTDTKHVNNDNFQCDNNDIQTGQSPNVPNLVPGSHGNNQGFNPNASSFQGFDIAHFLMKKDLSLSRLSKFNDHPESYAIWKSNFRSVVSDVNISPVEEFDMLIRWLGPESNKHAVSIRAASADNPERGLLRLWDRLDERYGCPEMVKASLEVRLSSFPKLANKDCVKLYDLADLVAEIDSFKQNPKYSALLSYYDSSSGVIPIVQKLPFGIQERWTSRAFRYKQDKNVPFPPFTEFVTFLREVSKLRNDPSFSYESSPSTQVQCSQARREKSSKPFTYSVQAKKTEVGQRVEDVNTQMQKCPIHHTGHTLNECKLFRSKPYEERKDYLKSKGFCYKCCMSRHLAVSCTENPRCDVCNSYRHATALHNDNYERPNSAPTPTRGNVDNGKGPPTRTSTSCTQICGDGFQGKSCAKIVPVKVYQGGQPQNSVKLYAVLDDQSNSSLAKAEFFDLMNIEGPRVDYTLSSCSGTVRTTGRGADGFKIESLDGSCRLNLPTLMECCQIPDTRNEIATPAVARHYPHLSDLTEVIPPVDDSAKILLLIGRDMTEAHHVLDQRVGPGRSPYAQRLPLGWVIVGETCLGRVHAPDQVDSVTVMKTHCLSNGRPTVLKPCPNDFLMKDCINDTTEDPLFIVTKDDDKTGLSQEDRQFLNIMDQEMIRGPQGNWIAPLPFKDPRPTLPNNKEQAARRAESLKRSLDRDPVKSQQMTDFMEKILSANHAERAPQATQDSEVWYLPLFGVHLPKKPHQIRGVFDSSAAFAGISLNSVLMKGPDIANRLLGVLLRFRKEAVAVMGDIEKMFHCFHVPEKHRDYLRFLWHEENDTEKELVEYRMKVHVFGNKPSPAIATIGLRKVAESSSPDFGQDVEEFVKTNFYVDDGLTSLPTVGEAIDLVQRTQKALKTHGNIRFHKIASNSPQVMSAFSPDDRASDLKDMNLTEHGEQSMPRQRSLGMYWDVNTDMFVLQASVQDKPNTKRGVLSTVHSIYDPMGLLAPVTIKGRLILRDIVSYNGGWDDLLPEQDWSEWLVSLQGLGDMHVPRPFTSLSFRAANGKRILMYCDASEKAIAAVCYLQLENHDGESQLGFIKSKVAPKHGHTIPRLELCAAVLSVELADLVCNSLDIPPTAVTYHSDSKIVLGYIRNSTKRFTVYISNRVARILRSSSTDQWNYVRTDNNPADEGTRSIPASQMPNSAWILGPPQNRTGISEDLPEELDMEPEQLPEIRVQTTRLKAQEGFLDVRRFERFSTWRSLVNGIAQLKHFVKCKTKGSRRDILSTAYEEAEKLIIKQVQYENFQKEIDCFVSETRLPTTSPLVSLDPFLDDHGLLRVGGRLRKTNFEMNTKHPLILPRNSHISRLLILHYHHKVEHQGRHLTEGAVRSAGYWIIGTKRIVSSIIHRCVTCRKLRGRSCSQKMSDLPRERLEPSPPFTYVGVDVFGHWNIVARRTRGGLASCKRWAVLFTCLVCRAVHIEVIEDLSTDAFVNALRRFVAIRGNVKKFKSDRGTNFVGATDVLGVNVVNVEDRGIKKFLRDSRTDWEFNPPHASHMGGAWERLIGVCRRVLDSLLASTTYARLTHDMLITLMAEVCAIVNNRPIVPVSADPESPTMLSPATLLTQKHGSLENIGEPTQSHDIKTLYKSQWRNVQSLADAFWRKWKAEYLQLLQPRRKWHNNERNIQVGDVILLDEKNLHRNEWKLGVVETVIPSDDGKIRQATVRVWRDDKLVLYTRPITELTVLLPKEQQ